MKKLAFMISVLAVSIMFCAPSFVEYDKNERKTEEDEITNVSFCNELITEKEVYEVVVPEEIEDEDGLTYIEEIPLDEEWQRFVYDLCEEYNVPVTLVYGVIKQESGFDPDAVSYDGHDYGLMQIRDSNHEWLNSLVGYELDYKDAYDNVKAGIKLLSGLCDTYNDDYVKVLMAYNMGPTGASKLWHKGVNSTKYTERVMENKKYFEEVFYDKVQFEESEHRVCFSE